ncbi:transporter substrate-binding domain-containing protein [Pseudoponticoccus marisrubri]|uniref:transporter substrate-binding domain-containing protein n=1 Tax=Pseudoponticoccus marisrubri TaxID=1685382 RepID=UPI000A060F87|nr:transporter substrate-binding domain-containing protein [Pseudoponticoccus marisrubri]
MSALHGLARNGVLRAAINTGNRALVRVEGAQLGGVSPALAARLAERIGARLEPVVYPGAGRVFDDALQDRWDVAFLAIDPLRAARVSFTRPYHVIEATCAVRADAPIRDVDEIDRPGLRVLTSIGSAYDMYLTANLRDATLDRFGTPPESFAAFRDGRADVVAGVRASLDRFFAEGPEIRILPGVLTRVEQAMVLPGPDNPAITALDAFVAEALQDGFVSRALSG